MDDQPVGKRWKPSRMISNPPVNSRKDGFWQALHHMLRRKNARIVHIRNHLGATVFFDL